MSTELTPAQRVLRAKIAAYASWANTENRAARTKAARDGWIARFEKQVDPDGVLDPEERAQRADSARKAFLLQMSFKSAAARRAKRSA